MNRNSSTCKLVFALVLSLAFVVSNPPALAQTGGWSTKAPMPTARAYLAAGVMDSLLYVVGGTGSAGSTFPTMEAYDPATNTWTPKAPMNTSRGYLALGVLDGRLYAVGGWNGSGSPGFLNTLEIYDPTTDTWGYGAPLPTARASLGVKAIGGKLYALGGQVPGPGGCGDAVATLEVYDPSTDGWSLGTSMPTARWGLGVEAIGGNLYAVGGMTTNCAEVLGTLEVYDPASDAWTAKAPMPIALANPTVVAVHGVLYVVGGQTTSGAITTVQVYYPETNRWRTFTSLPAGRYSSAGGVIDGTLYVAGGLDAANIPLSLLEAYGRILSPTDVFGIGVKNVPDNDMPMLFRLDEDGNMLWEKPLPFTHLFVYTQMADRNVTEDAFYVNISANGWNKVDDKARIQKYDAYGDLVWDLALAQNPGAVSANPLLGGIYATAGNLGVYRIDGSGTIVWGPRDFGIPSCSGWGSFTEVTTGGAFVANSCDGVVLKIDKDGNEIWRKPVQYASEGLRIDPSPLDGGVYVGTGPYARHQFKLNANGDIEWSKYDYPSQWTYERTVSPVDGAIYIATGWPALMTKIAPDGNVLWSVPNDDHAGYNVGAYGLAADIEEDYFYTGDGYGHLGISKFRGSDVTSLIDNSALIWHIDPGYYIYTSGYGPVYRIWTGTPAPNRPPVVYAGGPFDVGEGSAIELIASGSDPDGDPLDYAWDLDNDGSFETPGQTVTFSAAGLDGPSSHTVAVQATDTGGLTATDQAIVNVLNVAPTVGLITAPVDPVQVGTTINTSAGFIDPGIPDTHTAVWDWGDGSTSAGTVNETGGSGSTSGSHSYTEAGVYTIKVTVTDDDGDSGESIYQYVVVYDPNGGFVTGGGWIDSPEGAYIADQTLTGKANFGFVSKYKKGATVPTGVTEFQFKVADLNFHSNTYDWLVIAGAKAQYKGIGTINGDGEYKFLLTGIDADINSSDNFTVDRFRIKIWSEDASGVEDVIYDNGLDSEIDDDNATTEIGGGSIVIHKK